MPIEVLEEMKNDLTDFRGTGMGITEISHRSPVFQDMLDETKAYLPQMMNMKSSSCRAAARCSS